MPSKGQQIVILRVELAAAAAEAARLRGLYDATVAANVRLQEQLLVLAGREPAAGMIVREVMAGFKSVMAPDVAAMPEPADVFGAAGRQLADALGRPDPAWEVPAEWGAEPDSLADVLEREGLEDG